MTTPVARSLTVACSFLLLACADRSYEGQAGAGGEDTAAAATTPAAAVTAVPAGMAGRWNLRTTAEGGDSVLVESVLIATASDTGWIQNLPNRDPIPVRVVHAGGDSVVTEAGPYPSVLREGVTVRTQSVYRMQGDRLVGQIVARYEGAGADSVMRLRSEGTRAP